jgi:hypothetical protein
MDPRGEDITEPTTEEEFEREYADVDVDYHEFTDAGEDTDTPLSDDK